MRYIIALDQGTTSSRAILFNEKGGMVGVEQKEFTQFFPKPGWVEHDAEEIWSTQAEVLRNLLSEHQVNPEDIAAIGITNQRETTVVWDRETGEPICRAIVWQDKRTSGLCEELKKQGKEEMVKQKTGLVIDSYFSGTKVNWVLENVPEARARAERGELCFGTIDSWLVWKLTKGAVHATDYTNASRTLLYNIVTNQWDDELLELLQVPKSMLPEAHPSSHHFGDFEYKGRKIPIMGIAGDQQAALFGQACFEPGQAKNTYGTGCFMLMNTGSDCQLSKHGLLTTMACSTSDKLTYALEGSIFIAGAAIQWLRDGLRIIDHASDSQYFAEKAQSDEVFLVPAFAGLGAPYWDQYSRGAIFGLTRDTGKNEIVKAALESIAFQTRDVKDAMEQDSGISLSCLMVDGGATANDYLMQFQADILGVAVDRPAITESTALGAAYLAGLQAGVWKLDDLKKLRQTERKFEPEYAEDQRNRKYKGWQKAVKRTFDWAREDEV
ncbi:glycerol kinase GlpK [Marinoscillum furvescens]|uniref:Glycerol kinase n=1 Tax=Marinoscillum furvescens DSM 4134 TaxID=1122208 RepID=A0A3D9KZR3_MARFU|nr:glycerol kinase GlpK [Marinoscillum furvescens]RED93615.1 glycerol kinase [Marinoscillum furvescens DSM 4134]